MASSCNEREALTIRRTPHAPSITHKMERNAYEGIGAKDPTTKAQDGP